MDYPLIHQSSSYRKLSHIVKIRNARQYPLFLFYQFIFTIPLQRKVVYLHAPIFMLR